MKLFIGLGVGLIGLLSLVTFEPITISILALIIGGAIASAVIKLALLTITIVRNWFRQNNYFNWDLSRFIAKHGKRYVAGFFDENTNKIADSQTYEPDEVDDALRNIIRRDDEVVVLT